MKLKYYLRGLGTGIIVTAIVMSFIKKPEELTDAEIRIRAMKLGMVEKSVLADFQEDDEKLSEKEEVKNTIKYTRRATRHIRIALLFLLDFYFSLLHFCIYVCEFLKQTRKF